MIVHWIRISERLRLLDFEKNHRFLPKISKITNFIVKDVCQLINFQGYKIYTPICVETALHSGSINRNR